VSVKVTAVVVDWNGAALTRACLGALAGVRHDGALDVVLVDNGSDDPTALAALADPPRVRVLRLAHNVGFGAGCNAGIRVALDGAADWIWLVNNDAAPEPGALAAMLAHGATDPTIGAVGCVIDESPDGGPARRVYGGGDVSFVSGLPRHRHAPHADAPVDYLCAASVLVRRQALARTGLFDERFFLYWEDVDLSFRLRSAGFRLAVASDAVVHHRAHASLDARSPAYDRHFTRSSVLFFRKHAAAPRWPIAVSAAGRLVKRLAAGRPANARAVWDGVRLGCSAEGS
jgi:GT2 family glycosyltransferase